MRIIPALVLIAALLPAPAFSQTSARATKKIVLIAGRKSHGPGAHEYVKSVKLLKVMLDRAPSLKGVRTEVHFNGWPENPATLDSADTIMMISDGQDGDQYAPVPFMTAERMPVMEKQMKRGCGLITFHFSTFAPDRLSGQMLDWVGGYFDWQGENGQRQWYSAIKTLDTEVQPASEKHPILNGVRPFKYKEEFYYQIRFREGDPRLQPILRVPALPGNPLQQTVAWAVERSDGGRGFGATIGHYFDSWENPDYRKLILNAIVWTAKAEVPKAGVEAQFVAAEEVDRALISKPIKTLIITGDNHPAHKWKETTLALIEALNNRGPEYAVTVAEDPEQLAASGLRQYQLIVLNYCNWTRPGLSPEAKANLTNFAHSGGGLAIIHFANGAFHASLPDAPPSDWPEYRKLVARVWDHAKGKSGHDPYGPLRVDISAAKHPITKGLASFDTTDELYFRQQGDLPVLVLATARSKVTNADEPMAMVYRYGKGRVFQTLLGHSAASIATPGATQLIRRGCAWTAGGKP